MARRSLLISAAAGAAAAYFLDPNQGRARRARARDRSTGLARRTARRAARTGRWIAGEAHGLKQKLDHPVPENLDYNDPTLVQVVESRLFGRRDVPKGSIVIDAEFGVITLRGQVDRPGQARAIKRLVARVPGVRGVRSYLHLPGTPPPNKLGALAV